jgi:hypothetical protein
MFVDHGGIRRGPVKKEGKISKGTDRSEWQTKPKKKRWEGKGKS